MMPYGSDDHHYTHVSLGMRPIEIYYTLFVRSFFNYIQSKWLHNFITTIQINIYNANNNLKYGLHRDAKIICCLCATMDILENQWEGLVIMCDAADAT